MLNLALDLIDNLLGPLNGVARLDWLIRSIICGNTGHEFKVRYQDSGGTHSREEIERILKRYGVICYGRLHDAKHMYFFVKRRQAKWAEYLLLHAGVKVLSKPVARRVQRRPAGWMPKPWRATE